MDPQECCNELPSSISEQKTVNTILMNLQPILCASAPARSKTSLLSGAPAEHLTFGAMLDERRKIEEEKPPRFLAFDAEWRRELFAPEFV